MQLLQEAYKMLTVWLKETRQNSHNKLQDPELQKNNVKNA